MNIHMLKFFLYLYYIISRLVDILTLTWYLPLKWLVISIVKKKMIPWRLVTGQWELYVDNINDTQDIFAFYIIPDKNYLATLARLFLFRVSFTLSFTEEEYCKLNRYLVETKNISTISNYIKNKYKYESTKTYILD